MTLDVATALMHAVEAVIEMPCTATVLIRGRRWVVSITRDMELECMTATSVYGAMRMTAEAPKITVTGYDRFTEVALDDTMGGGMPFVRLLHDKSIIAIDIEVRGEKERFWSRDNGETSDGNPRPADGDDAGHDDGPVRADRNGPAGRDDDTGRGPDDRRHGSELRE